MHVDSATFDKKLHKWLVETSSGEMIYCRWFIPCIGFASRRYTPPFQGLGNFKGDVYHTAVWPQHDVNMRGKRVAVVGTGASGIQVIQTIGPKVDHLTVFQRTPNMCLPMKQTMLDEAEEQKKKAAGQYEEEFAKTRTTFAGFTYDFVPRNTLDDTEEEREAFYHKILVEDGGFKFWLNTYKDMLFDLQANEQAYNFWRKTVQKRIPDPKKAELLAPKIAPHPWGTKRPSLEQNVYEVFSQANVAIVDVNESPILEVTARGLVTKEGLVDVDIIVLATGFDSVTGALAQLNIRGTDGQTIAEHWRDGTRTSLGIAMARYPNMFFLYGPQAPTAFSNGPTCTQFQAEFVEKALRQLTREGVTYFEAKESAEAEWCERMAEAWSKTLFPMAKSWYQGANIPGRRVEPLNWYVGPIFDDGGWTLTCYRAGGMPAYTQSLDQSLDNGYQAWIVAK
jgi:cation diffusion facilitator CzcD-associated flavoprotein CzcO